MGDVDKVSKFRRDVVALVQSARDDGIDWESIEEVLQDESQRVREQYGWERTK